MVLSAFFYCFFTIKLRKLERINLHLAQSEPCCTAIRLLTSSFAELTFLRLQCFQLKYSGEYFYEQ